MGKSDKNKSKKEKHNKKEKKDKKSKKEKKIKKIEEKTDCEDDQFHGFSDIELSDSSFEEDLELEIENIPMPPDIVVPEITDINKFIIEEITHLTYTDRQDILKIIVNNVGTADIYESSDGSRINLKNIPSDSLNEIKNLMLSRLKAIV